MREGEWERENPTHNGLVGEGPQLPSGQPHLHVTCYYRNSFLSLKNYPLYDYMLVEAERPAATCPLVPALVEIKWRLIYFYLNENNAEPEGNWLPKVEINLFVCTVVTYQLIVHAYVLGSVRRQTSHWNLAWIVISEKEENRFISKNRREVRWVGATRATNCWLQIGLDREEGHNTAGILVSLLCIRFSISWSLIDHLSYSFFFLKIYFFVYGRSYGEVEPLR